MAKDATFDVVSEFDAQELTNAVDQASRDINARFDLKDTATELVLNKEDITITTANDFALQNVLQILEEKIIKRSLSPFLLDAQSNAIEHALGNRVRQVVKLNCGIDKELAKKIVSEIKETKLKVQASIQGEQVRVNGKNRDDLQAVITHLKQKSSEWEKPLQFQNFR
ncbi:MAG: YajQ family cyclic di-GMP-binding protein [Vampirovibrionales bacterium]|jgi:uncharacterized protein YajQ (UPF0234 family)|nr:YajQ family cyclic di-GMP-binding protein [Vampirovibrionales bacterium]